MNIKTFGDASKHAVNGEWYPSVENYPALKFLLHWDDVRDGDTTWTDRIAGRIVSSSTAFTKDADGVLDTGAGTTIDAGISGLGQKDLAAIWQGTISAANGTCELGEAYSSGKGIRMKGAGGDVVFAYPANYISSGVLGMAYPIHCLTHHVDLSANQVRKTGSNSAGTETNTVLKTGGAGTINQDWDTLFAKLIISSTASVKMLALFAFETPLSTTELEVANKWMAANDGKLYPGFAGKL